MAMEDLILGILVNKMVNNPLFKRKQNEPHNQKKQMYNCTPSRSLKLYR